MILLCWCGVSMSLVGGKGVGLGCVRAVLFEWSRPMIFSQDLILMYERHFLFLVGEKGAYVRQHDYFYCVGELDHLP